MALEYLTSVRIMRGQPIDIPRATTHYQHKSGKLQFIRVNLPIDDPEVRALPEEASKICFPEYTNENRGIARLTMGARE
ncbi:hypothetical protein HOA55_04135 [archaeon]|jgi:hypothetical protein|nr:hypothetical protein [archaeon]MBT6820518.1 hypothetical protein [archaeon]MBT7238963.1 hypothetical protein [archaeon]MBT7567717.1 hypothetical protein [archaeon]